MNKKILITGSCGFVGSNLLRKIFYEKLPYYVTSIDRVNSNKNSLYYNKGHVFHIADVRDQHIIDTIFKFEEPDIVIHAASENPNDLSINDPNEFISNNVLGTQVVINACLKYNVNKFIYLSTDKVYNNEVGTGSYYEGSDDINPRNVYTASKIAGELMVRSAGYSSKLNHNIVRLSNNYGPHQPVTKLIPQTIKHILNNEKITVYDQGMEIRNWSHIFDTCEAIIRIANDGVYNYIYNVSSNQEISNLELVQKICGKINKNFDLISFIKSPRTDGYKSCHSMSCSRINQLGWKPSIKLSDGLDSCINWYQMNQWILK